MEKSNYSKTLSANEREEVEIKKVIKVVVIKEDKSHELRINFYKKGDMTLVGLGEENVIEFFKNLGVTNDRLDSVVCYCE